MAIARRQSFREVNFSPDRDVDSRRSSKLSWHRKSAEPSSLCRARFLFFLFAKGPPWNMEWGKPDDWNDEDRARFLFSPLPPSRADKPTQWDAKVSFWSDLVVSSCQDLQQASVEGSDLEARFVRNGMRPSSLGRIVGEMCRSGRIRTLHDWESQCKNSQSWLAWSSSLAWKPISWAAKSVLGEGDSMNGVYVIPHLIEVGHLDEGIAPSRYLSCFTLLCLWVHDHEQNSVIDCEKRVKFFWSDAKQSTVQNTKNPEFFYAIYFHIFRARQLPYENKMRTNAIRKFRSHWRSGAVRKYHAYDRSEVPQHTNI